MIDDTIYLKTLEETHRCRPEVQKAADFFSDLTTIRYEALLKHLLASAKDTTLGILLNVCAVNKIKLNPHLLAEALKIIEPIPDLGFAYGVQGPESIALLLAAALAEDISWERQAYAVTIAAELALKHGTDRQPVRKVALKLSNSIRGDNSGYILGMALSMLEMDPADTKKADFIIDMDILKALPKEKPPVIIGDGRTVRRPVPKLGRNAPCHCGSGKKYKKCCYEKDRELMRDASPYEGVTMTQVRSTPNLVAGTEIIDEMRAYELKKLDLAVLNPDQLFSAYGRAKIFGLRELALNFLMEFEDRLGGQNFDAVHYDYEDLLYNVIDAGEAKLAEKILSHIPKKTLREPGLLKMNLNILKHRHRFEGLEEYIRKSLTGDSVKLWDDPILRMGHFFENTFPALSIVFCRASISGNPENVFDNEMLLDVMRNARTEIGLEPWGDPIEEYLEWTLNRQQSDFQEESKNQEIVELTRKLDQAQQASSEKERELRQQKLELSRIIDRSKQFEKTEHVAVPALNRTVTEAAEDRETIIRLRNRIERLKGEIGSQQEMRRRLRQQLRSEHKKSPPDRQDGTPNEISADTEQPLAHVKLPKKILIPEYTPPFCSRCDAIPSPVVAKALRAAAGFAAHDESVWRQTKSIPRLPAVYRIRIGINHRLLICWEGGVRLQVLDLIPREDLQTWINKHSR